MKRATGSRGKPGETTSGSAWTRASAPRARPGGDCSPSSSADATGGNTPSPSGPTSGSPSSIGSSDDSSRSSAAPASPVWGAGFLARLEFVMGRGCRIVCRRCMRLRAGTTLFVAAGLMATGCGKALPPRPGPAGGSAGSTAATAEAGGAGDGIPETKADRGTFLALLYGASLQGEYENCGCPSHPLGGLARRATVIDRARGEADGVLVVDAGDMLLPELFHADKLRPAPAGERERRARLILSSYRRMGVTAVLPAERDLGVGPEKLKQLLKSIGVPAVASNLVDQQGHPLFDRDRLVTLAGISVGIFGVVAPLPEDAALWKTWRVRATDPTATAQQEAASLRARGAQMIVALLHLGPIGAANRLLANVPGIDWAVQGHTGMQLEPPSVVGGARQLDAAYNAESARRAAAGLAVCINLIDPHGPRPAPPARAGDPGQDRPTRYAGSAACASCHPAQSAVFATTTHAPALDALALPGRPRRDRDPTCVSCHTTGFMLPGGTWNVAVAVDKLRHVGCESCHGPSLGHISLADRKTSTRRDVPETVCRGCHTPAQTNGEFDYPKFRAAILGPGHGA